MRARIRTDEWGAAPGRPVLAVADPGPHGRAAQRRPGPAWPPVHEMMSRLAVLEQAPVFFTLPESALRSLARRLRRIHIPTGEMVVNQGDKGDTLFLIERGRFRVVVERPPEVVTVALLTEGDLFGEAATLLNRPQQASVYAQTEGTLLALDRQSLQSVVDGRHPEALETLRRLADQRFRVYADTTVQATWGMLLQEAAVVGVYSPKGGSGGTCLSLNLVGSLARRYPGEVLLLDLDFPYSHSALLAGMVPTSCLARMGTVPTESLEEVLLSAVLYHSAGPMILPGALRPEEADEVTPELINRAISVLRKTFRYIVVDLGVTITDSTLALFDLTQHVVLVAAPELSAVKSAADALNILGQLGTPHDRLTVVLNHRSVNPAVSKTAVERMLQRQVDVEVAFDGNRPEQAAVDGAILSVTNPRSEVAKGAETLAAILDAKHGRWDRRARAGQHAVGDPTAVGSQS